MKGVILLAGIHGVGKSTAAEVLAGNFSIKCYTASKIIKQMKNQILVDDANKLVSDIESNQKLLIKGIEGILEKEKIILLDGHLTLLNAEMEIEEINISVFKDLNLIGVMLLIEDPEVIYQRLESRDGKSNSLKLIAAHQDAEIKYADEVMTKLNLPIAKHIGANQKNLCIEFSNLLKTIKLNVESR